MAHEPKSHGGRPASPRPTGPHLVRSWADLHGALKPAALDELNETLQTRYTPYRLSEWEREVRDPGVPVIDYMLREVLDSALREKGLDDDAIADVIARVRLRQ